MRYTALILLLIVASETMPIVELDEDTSYTAIAESDVLSEVNPMAGARFDDELDLVFASYQPPRISPVRTGLAPGIDTVLPDTGIIAPPEPDAVAVAESDASPQEAPPEAPVLVSHENMAVARERAPDPREENRAPEAPPVEAADLRLVSATTLNVRAGPSSGNPVLGALAFGDKAAVTGERQGGWVQVRAIDIDLEGWVFSRYLTPVDGT